MDILTLKRGGFVEVYVYK